MKQFSATDIKVDNLSIDGHIDKLKLAAIEQTKSDTAVDVFVYDTSLDSDGGAWRKRTSHTSWYNEELNTTTRGGRREFPAVAVIVAEADKVTIYDGDDPDLPMWMIGLKFNASNRPAAYTCVHASNGVIVLGGQYEGVVGGIELFNFIGDTMFVHGTSGGRQVLVNVSDGRSGDLGPSSAVDVSLAIVNGYVNDITMTVLPDAPIDADTGLPVPTIAVATNGGINVIKHDGTIVKPRANYNTTPAKSVMFDDKNRLVVTLTLFDNLRFFVDYTSPDFAAFEYWHGSPYHGGAVPLTLGHNSTYTAIADQDAYGNVLGLTKHDISARGEETNFCYITSNYNTGWMPGDIKLATLSDTKTETVGVDSTELVTNSDFSSDTSGWSGTNSATLSVDNQRLKIQGGGESYPSAYTSIQVVEGVEYEVSARYISNDSSMSARVRISDPNPLAGDLINGTIKTPGSDHVYRFIAPHTGSIYVTLLIQDVNGNSSGIWDNVSVKQPSELITNGTFDDGTVGWLYADNGTSSQSVSDDGVLTLSHTTYTNSMLYQILDLIPGKKYVLTGRTGGTNFNLCNIRIGSSLGGNQFGGIVSSEATSGDLIDHVITFTPTQSTTYISLRINSSSPDLSCDFDNISVRLAEDDRSVNNNGLQVFGEIDKTPVAPGANLVAYSGFSANNYLVQPYNPDLDFGTGDFCVMGWFNAGSPTGVVKAILGKYDVWGSNEPDFSSRTGFNIAIHVDGSFYFYSVSNGVKENTPYENVGASLHTNTWNHFCVNRTGGYIKTYINGSEYSSVISNNINLSIDESIYIGKYPIIHSSCENGLSLIRISKTAPTADQIAKIYRDEKQLFQDGAQATLDGTSDAVTALAHDSVTDLLHVGTSSGTSVFSGLCRVTSDTEPVTTCIDAQDELVVKR